MGMCVAAVFAGAWWLVIISGVGVLAIQRSYSILALGVLLDIWFSVSGASFFYIGFYTILFLVTTVVFEFVRSKLLWTS